MCQFATVRVKLGFLSLLLAAGLMAQSSDWRRIGNSAMELSLPGAATGAVSRIWYSQDGGTLFAALLQGQVWETQDFEHWKPSLVPLAPRGASPASETRPEPAARVEQAFGRPGRWYAVGRFVYRSDDQGVGWTNLTAYRNESILGEGLADLAVSPRDPDEVSVSGTFGVWRSLDGGATWSGLNEGLPNLPAQRILALPNGYRSARILARDGQEIEWKPGEKIGWRPASSGSLAQEQYLKAQVGARWSAAVTAAVNRNEWIYAGSQDGRLFSTSDRGLNWQSTALPDTGPARKIFVNPSDSRSALAAMGNRLLHTMNGGQFWNDITGSLSLGINGLTADVATGTVYVATAKGVYFGALDLQNLGAPPPWQLLGGAPANLSALDLELDEGGNQLFILTEGFGLYATMAPHRTRQLAIVNAADFSNRPAAPGSLLTILGGRFDRVSQGSLTVPVLGRTDAETQIQVPFEAKGDNLSFTLESTGNSRQIGLPLARVSPAIFIDRDGSPLLLDADSGLTLDAKNPGKSGTRIQILATGLGAVNPAWATGVVAPPDNAPQVVAPVRVFLDREAVPVTRATLAPGYVGFYLIEIQLPKLVNAGPAELFLAAGEEQSNRVTLYLAP